MEVFKTNKLSNNDKDDILKRFTASGSISSTVGNSMPLNVPELVTYYKNLIDEFYEGKIDQLTIGEDDFSLLKFKEDAKEEYEPQRKENWTIENLICGYAQDHKTM